MKIDSTITSLEVARVPTPVGPIVLAVADGALCALEFADRSKRFFPRLEKRFGGIESGEGARANAVADRLRSYLEGELQAIEDIEVKTGGTEFQREVWAALRTIPAGQTLAYGELARRIGRPKAVRAVGAANGSNPVSIVVPCHRVIAADGRLHGYGGGLERKRWLLNHETQHAFRLQAVH